MPKFEGLKERALASTEGGHGESLCGVIPEHPEMPDLRHVCMRQIIAVDETEAVVLGLKSGGGALDGPSKMVVTKTVWVERCRLCGETNVKEATGKIAAQLKVVMDVDAAEIENG